MENTNKYTTAPSSYPITNWATYNRALIARGSLTVWVEEATVLIWQRPPQTGLPGHPVVYSDSLILLIGTLKELYRLPLRQTMGFVASLLQLAGLGTIPLPDYTTLQRRLRSVTVPLWVRQRQQTDGGQEPLVVLVDSTGVKVSGEGEWKVRMHGNTKRRKWRKLHIAQDYANWEILSMSVTDSTVGDETQVPALLNQALSAGQYVADFLGDGAYDKRLVYDHVQRHGGHVVVPPNKAAIFHQKDPVLQPRNDTVQAIRTTSLEDWKRASGYHRRSLVETTMFRHKRAFGDELLTTTDKSQYTQLALRVRLLNYFTSLGMPSHQPAPVVTTTG